VGFRATCRRLARTLPALAGQVCNLADGRVRLIVRGPKEDVADLVGRLHEAFPAEIRKVEQVELAAGDDPLPEGLHGGEISHGG